MMIDKIKFTRCFTLELGGLNPYIKNSSRLHKYVQAGRSAMDSANRQYLKED